MDFQGTWRYIMALQVFKTTREGRSIKKKHFFYESGTPTLEKCGNQHIRGELSSMQLWQ
jgi:hypothetical protein